MPKATLIIEDAEVEGRVNIHWACEPDLDDHSPAHNLMARVLTGLQEQIQQEAALNLREASEQHAQENNSLGG